MVLVVRERFAPQSSQEQAQVLSCAAKPEPRKGRCFKCKSAYFWPAGRLRLSDAKCPRCGSTLCQTAWYLKSVAWYRCDVAAGKSQTAAIVQPK
jgi:hypothetical protein